MARTVQKVIEIVGPIALDALATAAEALLAGAAARKMAATLPRPLADHLGDSDPGTVIENDTNQYCETNFASQYGYYYEGIRSQPTTGDLPIAAAQDIIVWENQNGVSDIQQYLQDVFKDSVDGPDSIELADNLSSILAQQFQQDALQWVSFSKRWNFPSGLIVDCYMVTAAASDINNNPAGVASFCFVAYNHHPQSR